MFANDIIVEGLWGSIYANLIYNFWFLREMQEGKSSVSEPQPTPTEVIPELPAGLLGLEIPADVRNVLKVDINFCLLGKLFRVNSVCIIKKIVVMQVISDHVEDGRNNMGATNFLYIYLFLQSCIVIFLLIFIIITLKPCLLLLWPVLGDVCITNSYK